MMIVDLANAPQQLSTIAQWHQSEWGHLYPGLSLHDRITMMQSFLAQNTNLPRMWVMMHEQKAIGTAALVACDLDTHPEWSPWLASVFVLPEHRKKGHGTALIRHAMRAAQQMQYSVLTLFTPDQSALYKSLGWFTIAQERYQGEDITLMQTHLANCHP